MKKDVQETPEMTARMERHWYIATHPSEWSAASQEKLAR